MKSARIGPGRGLPAASPGPKARAGDAAAIDRTTENTLDIMLCDIDIVWPPHLIPLIRPVHSIASRAVAAPAPTLRVIDFRAIAQSHERKTTAPDRRRAAHDSTP